MNPILQQKTNNYSTNFQARQIAKVITQSGSIKKEIQLYKLDKTDKPLAMRMLYSLNLKELYPMKNIYGYAHFPSWKTLIKGAVDRIGTENVILAVQDKHPCGIMSFYRGGKEAHLTRLATWNIKPDTRVKHAGKALMYELFKSASDSKLKNITLTASTIKPLGRNCQDFYSKLGFIRSYSHEPYNLSMPDTNYAMKCAQLENFFTHKKIEKPKEVNLNKELSLTFKDTWYEKFVKYFNRLTEKNSGNRS